MKRIAILRKSASCDLEQMMGERGVSVDHSTIFRWVQKYAPEIGKRLRWRWRRPRSTSWRAGETYVKVRGRWTYLYRAVDKFGNTIDFYLSPTRNTKAARRFLGKKERCPVRALPSCLIERFDPTDLRETWLNAVEPLCRPAERFSIYDGSAPL